MRSLPDPAGGLTAPPRPPAVLHAASGSVGLGHRGSHSPREKPPTKFLHQAPQIGIPALIMFVYNATLIVAFKENVARLACFYNIITHESVEYSLFFLLCRVSYNRHNVEFNATDNFGKCSRSLILYAVDCVPIFFYKKEMSLSHFPEV